MCNGCGGLVSVRASGPQQLALALRCCCREQHLPCIVAAPLLDAAAAGYLRCRLLRGAIHGSTAPYVVH